MNLNPGRVFLFEQDSGDACPSGYSLGLAGAGEDDHKRRRDINKNVKGGPQKDER